MAAEWEDWTFRSGQRQNRIAELLFLQEGLYEV